MDQINLDAKFKRWAQAGYGARGLVYLVVGGLALMTAMGNSEGQTTDSKGAILKILDQPFGNVMIAFLIIGLLGYVAWRLVQSIKDTDGHGTSAKGLAVRGGLFVSAITHILLAIWAARLLIGGSDSSGDSGGGLLSTGPGQIALGIAGLCVIGAGLAHIKKGWSAKFEKYMSIPADKDRWARPICQFGLAARGVVLLIVGWFLIRSAWMARGGDIEGMQEALQALRDDAYGPWLLGVVAAGLFAFGIYSLLEASYRRINTSGSSGL